MTKIEWARNGSGLWHLTHENRFDDERGQASMCQCYIYFKRGKSHFVQIDPIPADRCCQHCIRLHANRDYLKSVESR